MRSNFVQIFTEILSSTDVSEPYHGDCNP